MADDPILDALQEGAIEGIKEVDADGVKVIASPLTEQIQAHKYLAAQAALSGGRSAWGATRPARIVLPGAGDPKSSESTP